MFQRMIAIPYEEYAQLSGSKIQHVKQPEDQQFYDLERKYTNQEHIPDPYRRMMLQGETLDEMKALKEKMRSHIVSNSPKPYRNRARALYQSVESFLKFNDRGEIYDDEGKLVPDSHLEDLIQYAVRDRRRDIVPAGWGQFTNLLRKHNVPRSSLNRLTLDEIEGIPPKTPATPAARRQDMGATAAQPKRWPGLSTMRKRRRSESDIDLTPRKADKTTLEELKRDVSKFMTPAKARPKRFRKANSRYAPELGYVTKF